MRLLTRDKRYEGGMPPYTYLRRGFDLDPSCKLWLPFYKYGSEQTRIVDQSGSGNHGTIAGAVPATYPMLTPVVSSTAVTQTNMKISAVNGTAFVDFSLASVLTDYLNHLLVIKDSSGRVIQGFIKAAGTGGTFTDIIGGTNPHLLNGDMTAWTGDNPDSWTIGSEGAGYYVTQSGNAAQIVSDGTTINMRSGTLVQYALYYCALDLIARISGTLVFGPVPLSSTEYLATGTSLQTYSGYRTASGTGNYFIIGRYAACNDTVTNIVVKKVLTPSATGVTIVSTKDGATYNWTSKDASFNYNDSSGYTYTIYSIPGYMGLGWFGDGIDDRIVHTSINLGTTHTLHYWLLYQGISGVIHGGAANYHGLRLTPTACGYNVGTTEVTVTHSANYGEPVLFSIDRNGTSVDFYKNGVKIGTTQTLGANTAQVLTDFYRYSNGTSYFNGIIFDAVNINTNKGAQEIRNFFELTRSKYGV